MKLVKIEGFPVEERNNATEIFKSNDLNEILPFLDRKGDVHFPGKHGETALHWAAFHGNLKLIIELCGRKADMTLADHENQRTPIAWATKSHRNKALTDFDSIIQVLVDNGADPSERDHTRKNALDYDVKSPQRFFQKNPKAATENFLKKIAKNKPRTTLELDADDSSDEESSAQYEYAKTADDVQKNLTSNIFETIATKVGVLSDAVKLNFIVYRIGLGYLYHDNVNIFYYQNETGKQSLGTNQISGANKSVARSWIGAALKKAAEKVIYRSETISTTQLGRLEKTIFGEEGKDGVVDECLTCIRYILRQDFVKVKLRLNESMKANLNKKDLDKARKDDGALKGKRMDTILEESPSKLIAYYVGNISPTKEKNNEKCFNICLNQLVNRLRNECAELNGEQKKIVEAFDLIFFTELNNLQGKYNVNLIRGKNNPYLVEPFRHLSNAIGFFTSIRMNNRISARTARELYKSLNDYSNRTYDNSFLEKGRVKTGHYVHAFTQWHLAKGHCVQMKEILTTNLIRSQLVGNDKDISYLSLTEKISKYCTQFKLADADIAKWLGEIVNGKMANGISLIKMDKEELKYDASIHREFVEFLVELAALLFVCEPIRNPAAFVCHQMMLDLIQSNCMTWKDTLASQGENGGSMPMSMEDAVPCARYLHTEFAACLPHEYKYAGEVSENYEKIKDLMQRTERLIMQWYKVFGKSKDLDVDQLTQNLQKNLNLATQKTTQEVQINIQEISNAFILRTARWYPAL